MRSHICALALLTAFCAACERPYERVNAPAPENLARNVAPPAAEEQRAAQAAPQGAPLRSSLPSSEAISDAMITAKIRAALLGDPGMSGADVSVNTEHGVVVLAGNVKSYEQAGIASAYAQRQDGVMRVDNQLALAAQ